MKDILKLARIEIVVIIVFAIMKILIRPFVLDNDFALLADIFVLSFPNLAEGIIGTLSVCMFGLIVNHRWLGSRLSEKSIYILAICLAAIYVLTQEFRIHNLGGNNIYDPYDVVFSIIGLLIGYLILHYLKPKIYSEPPV